MTQIGVLKRILRVEPVKVPKEVPVEKPVKVPAKIER